MLKVQEIITVKFSRSEKRSKNLMSGHNEEPLNKMSKDLPRTESWSAIHSAFSQTRASQVQHPGATLVESPEPQRKIFMTHPPSLRMPSKSNAHSGHKAACGHANLCAQPSHTYTMSQHTCKLMGEVLSLNYQRQSHSKISLFRKRDSFKQSLKEG